MTRPNLLVAIRRRPRRVLLWVATVFVISFFATAVATWWTAALIFPATLVAWNWIGRESGQPGEPESRPSGAD